MKVLAIIQARMSSSRLPGKVLKPLAGKPMVIRMVERVCRASLLDNVVVATSTDSSDDKLVSTLTEYGINCFRGNLNDVLKRYCDTVEAFGPSDAIMRLTADCPLIDWHILDQLVELFFSNDDYAYCSNVHPPTFPDGMDAEIFSRDALYMSCENATSSYEREHVTPYIVNHPELFPYANLTCSLGDLSHYRLTVDELNDYKRVCIIFNNLYLYKKDFTLEDILLFLRKNPEIMKIN